MGPGWQGQWLLRYMKRGSLLRKNRPKDLSVFWTVTVIAPGGHAFRLLMTQLDIFMKTSYMNNQRSMISDINKV